MRKMADEAPTQMLREAYERIAVDWEELANKTEGAQAQQDSKGAGQYRS